MAEPRAIIRVTRRYSAPPDRVFDAWLDPEVAGKWLFATACHPMARVAIDARVRGSFCLVDRAGGDATLYTGSYVEINPPRRLVFTLSADRPAMDVTRVTVEIAPSQRGSEMRLVHERVPAQHASRTEARWTGILYGLAETLRSNSFLKKGAKPPFDPRNRRLLKNASL